MRLSSLSFALTLVTSAAIATWSCGDSSPSQPTVEDAGPDKDGGPPVKDGAVPDAPRDEKDSAPPPPTVKIASSTPEHGASNVAVGDPMRVEFSEPVKVGASSVSLATRAGTPLPTTATLSDDKRTITLVPASTFPVPVDVRATFGEITGLDGKALAPSSYWEWGVPNWYTMGQTTPRRDPREPSIVVGPGGIVTHASIAPLEVNVIDGAKGTWKKLGETLHADAKTPVLALDPTGAPVVAFAVYLPTKYIYELHVRRWNGNAWVNVGTPFPNFEAGARHDASMAIDAAGKIYVAYEERVSGTTYVNGIVQYFEAGAWHRLGGPIHAPPAADGNTYWPQLAIDKAGGVHVSYTLAVKNQPTAGHVRKWSGGAWVPVGSTFAPPGDTAFYVRIAFDSAGQLYALGSFENSTIRRTFRVRRFDGTNWVDAAELHSTSQSQRRELWLTAGHNGHMFAFWQDADAPALRGADVTATGWQPIDASFDIGYDIALGVDPAGLPIVACGQGVLRLNR